jgi:hypothetical protein
MKRLLQGIFGALGTLLIFWFLLSGKISYAETECSKGTKACVVGIAVALGLVDVTEEDGRCVGDGCNH